MHQVGPTALEEYVDAEPQHALSVERIIHVEPPDAELPPSDGVETIIATFETPETASEAFETVATQVDASNRLKLFGQTLVLELPAGSEEVYEQFARDFKSQDAEVLAEFSAYDTELALECVAPNEEAAEEIEKESQHYFMILTPMHAIPPWSPAATLTDQHRHSRVTHERLVRGPDLDEDPILQRLNEQMASVDVTTDMAAFKGLQEKYQQQMKKLQEEFRQHLRGMGDEQVDVTLIDIYEKRPQYDPSTAESGTDSENAGAAYSKAVQQWNVDIGARLGQMPLVDGNPELGSDRYSATGGVVREGLQLRFSYLLFCRVYDGPEAMVEWLHAKGCAEFRYGFGGIRADAADGTGWLLVLDTKGINVWCAAGKGTFGTDEIVHRAAMTKLAEVVSHRRLIVPQLGAPGVAAHQVKELSGFRVVYGPVRAADLPAFLEAGMKATPNMRRVRFSVLDRLAVAPVELMIAGKSMVLITACIFLLAGLGSDGFDWSRVTTVGLRSVALFLATCIGSIVLAPTLLPWLPGRAFAAKGAWLGLLILLGPAGYLYYEPAVVESWFAIVAWCLLIPAVASFLAMNFTGASTYTSLSGVRLEVRVAAPIQATCAILGSILWLEGRFV